MVSNIQQGRPNKGQEVYMATCPQCGKRKRLNLYQGKWQFWCSTDCRYTEIIGTEAELKASLSARRATAE